MLSGTLQLMFRFDENHGRYILGMTPTRLYLQRESPWGKISSDLATYNAHFAYGTWYNVVINANLNHIQVNVDGLPCINYTDPSLLNLWPLWQGTIGLEVTPDASAHAYFDDVDVFGVVPPERTWTRTGGPIGGLGYDIRFGSSIQEMYVTDNYSGVFKSGNNGVSWYPSNRGITGRFWPSGDAIPVFTLNLDENDSSIVWAGLKDVKGVFKSTDSGNTWVDKTPNTSELPETNFVFRGFTVMPGDSDIVFAAGEIPSDPTDTGKEFDRVGGRVLRSDDGGDHWTSIWKGDNLARYVIVRPDNTDVIYVSTGIFDREADNSDCAATPIQRGGVGILKGVKSGSIYNWTVITQTHGLADLYVGSLVMHPSDPDILLAGAGNISCSVNPDGSRIGGVFISQDGGLSWTQTLTNDIITSVEWSPSMTNVAYAGGREHFYKSTNGGISWDMVAGQTFPWGPPGIVAGFPIDVLVDPVEPLTLFANNYGGGTVKSIDGGVNWTLASQGYTGALLYDVSIHPSKPGVVYTTGKSGTFRSLNGGDAWQGLTYPPADLIESYSVALKPDNPQIVLASTELMGSVYRSQDGGSSWSKVYQLTTGGSYGSHGFKRIVFSTTYGHTNIVYAGSCVYHVALNADPTTPSYGIFKSVDDGDTWQPANDSQTSDTCVNQLAIHPDNPDIVYAATAAEGLYKTENGGMSWTRLTGLSPTDIRAVAIYPPDPNIIYVGTDGYGVYRSDNAGLTWAPLVTGMEPNDRIWALVFDPVDPQTIYAGSFLTGVYQWVVGEAQWVHINVGLRTRAVTDLAISEDGQVLYASTYGEGIFRSGEIPPEKVFLPLIMR
jgi:photosystem II stability/assembly factor-like uncharacterized protein